MWRAFFLAVGIYLCVLGVECLFVDRAYLGTKSESEESIAAQRSVFRVQPLDDRREFKPKDWMPWSMLSSGAVVILYSFTIPRRVSS